MGRSRSPRSRRDRDYDRDRSSRYRTRSRSRSRDRSRNDRSPRRDGPRRIEEKLRKFEERRQEDAQDSRYEWGSASRQHEQEQSGPSRVARLEEMKTASFSRYADDEQLNKTLKQEVRWDDPARGFVEALKPTVQKHRFQPNRFEIPPGRHWDGIDRSNGFEVKLFQKRASNRVKSELGHQFSVQNY